MTTSFRKALLHVSAKVKGRGGVGNKQQWHYWKRLFKPSPRSSTSECFVGTHGAIGRQWSWTNERGVVAGLFVGLVLASSAQGQELVGRAYDLASGELVYTEAHYFFEDKRHQVIYREPGGDVFAEKMLNYSHGDWSPAFEQTNHRFREEVTVSHMPEGQVFASYSSRKKTIEQKLLPLSKNTVIDAGFNAFIQSHWQSLVSEDSMQFDYLVPSRLELLTLSVKSVDCQLRYRCFEIRAANPVIAFLMGEIHLKYDAESHQLVEFSGRSNIAQENGKYHKVRIEYSRGEAVEALQAKLATGLR